MTALLPSEIPMNRLTISGLFAPQPPPQFFSNFFLHSVYRREGSIANTHAEWVIMVWRKAAVSARKAEDHAERRRPVNQPRGLNRRESAPFDSARRRGCSAGIPRPSFFGFTAATQPVWQSDRTTPARILPLCRSLRTLRNRNTFPCTTAPAVGFCCPSPTLLPAKPSWRRRICSIFR